MFGKETIMREFCTVLLGLSITLFSFAQSTPEVWPHQLTWEEVHAAERYDFSQTGARGITTPPPYDNLRTSAEWEEIQALVIGWEGYSSILKRITAAAKEECEVIILSEEPDDTESYLVGQGGGGPLNNLDNVTIIETDLNTIWARDYSGTTVYADEVGDALMVDWIYNRPRPDDDASPALVADHLGLELYCTTDEPNDLMGTGGNWMTDGFGTGFASELILDENDGGFTWWNTAYPNHSEAGVDQIFQDFMGIDTYIKMQNLPFDGIHHIDMHMKLLDEKRLLVAEYPSGVADGPQINANIDYVLSNYTTKWGTPFEVIRIPSPPQYGNGNYPNQNGWYLTYTNSLFVNNTVLVPTYYEQYDTTAIRIYQEALPGYNIVGIDCDTSPNNIIQLSGALHCITHEVGANDPLLISHEALPDTDDEVNDYEVVAYMNHRQGVVEGTLFWKTDLADDYQTVSMSNIGGNDWQAFIPAQPVGSTIYYYVEGVSEDGKVQTRPMPAPEGYWSFRVLGEIVHVEENDLGGFEAVYPNPASAITCVPLTLNHETKGSLELMDLSGRVVETIFQGSFPQGEKKYFFNAAEHAAGAYFVRFTSNEGVLSQKVMVK